VLNSKVNIIFLTGVDQNKEDTVKDLSFLTGATVIKEVLVDDMDLITVDCLGKAEKSVTNAKNTVLTTLELEIDLEERIKTVKKAIKNEKNPFLQKKLKDRLAMLTGKVGMVRVGAVSKVE